MANTKGKTEGGSGGKRGHSNMNHWVKTEEIKDGARRQRRQEDKMKTEFDFSEIDADLKVPSKE